MKHWRTYVTAVLFLGPFVVLQVLFQWAPIVQMVRDSLYSFSLLNMNQQSFVGVDNFTHILHDQIALQSIQVSLTFVVALVILEIPLGLALALLVNRHFRGVSIMRAILFTPVVTSVVVVSTMWLFLLDPTHGLVNGFLAIFHLGPFGYLTSLGQALPSIVMMTLWEQLGFSMMLYLAGLQGIPPEYHEAAAIDGANRWQRCRTITLPLLARTHVLVVVVMTVFALQAFAPAFVMTQGGPEGNTDFMVYNIYQQAFQFQAPGYASALSVVLFAIILAISLTQMRVLRARWEY